VPEPRYPDDFDVCFAGGEGLTSVGAQRPSRLTASRDAFLDTVTRDQQRNARRRLRRHARLHPPAQEDD
jgi:hypothetical protein